MARYVRLNCRLCRREGIKLFLKGPRCGGPKCAVARRSYAPGQHGQRRTKYSNYGIQLREKQKVKRMYGVLERQFRKYFAIASKSKGVTGKILLQLLERRIDNIIFRAGFAVSRDQARQIVRHNFVHANGKRVNIPSYLVKKDELIAISAKSADKLKPIRENIELSKERAIPGWLEVNTEKLEAKVNRLPEKEDIALPIQEQLIVELYSK
ncbi:MAG: 30S ribosomal protein S4 [Candidatus Omnitrophota bacterium]